MPFDIADLWDETRSIDIDYKGRSFTIEYAPERYDTQAIAALSRYTQQVETLTRTRSGSLPDPDPLVDALMRCLVGWSVRMRDEPWPLTRENLASMHWEALTTMLGQIGADQGVSEKNGKSSPTTSPNGANSGKRRPNGTA
jgi:hypothetical protein